METGIIIEDPIFTLRGGSGWSDESDELTLVGIDDLKRAGVGQEWLALNRTNIGRDAYSASLKVVYKDQDGVAVLLRCWGTRDTPAAPEWEDPPVLHWVEFLH